MFQPHRVWSLFLFLALTTSALQGAEQVDPLFYLPLDGAPEAKVAGGEAKPRVEGNPTFREGVLGEAVMVGGKDRLVYHAAGNFNVRQGTCTLWVSPVDWTAGVDTFQFLISFQNQRTNVDYLLYKICDSPVLAFLSREADARARVLQKGILSWRPGEWRHVAITWDERLYRLLIDGKVVAEQSAIPLPTEGWESIVLGTAYPGWARLGDHKTTIDEVRIYARALTPQEIVSQREADISRSTVLQRQIAERRETELKRKETNLALAANGAVVLTSSFADYQASYSDNAIDGDPDTAWRSFDNELPQWLELRWSYPITATSVAFTEVLPSHTTRFSVQSWDGKGAWKVVKQIEKVQGSNDGRVSVQFPAVTTDRLRLVIDGCDGPFTQYTEVEVYGPPQVNAEALRPYWKAYHLWYPEPDELVHQEPRYFRKIFTVPENEKVQSAFLQLYTNDLYTVLLNGVEVAKGFKILSPVSVGGPVHPGSNCLAIIATPTSQPGWPNMALAAELTVNTDAATHYIFTDDSLKTSREAAPGWEKPDFDDRAWQMPFIVARVGSGIWGRLPYADRATHSQIRVEEVEMPSGKLHPGDTAHVRLHLRPVTQLKDDYLLVYEAGDESALPGNGDYTVCRGSCQPSTPTSQWPTDRATVVEFPITLPNWTPQGEAPVRVNGLNIGKGRGLDLMDGNGKPVAIVGALHVDRFGSDLPELAPAEKNAPRKLGAEARVTTESAVSAFEINGRVVPPLIWAYENPTYEKIHLSSRTGVHLYQARNYPLQPDGTPESVARSCRLLDQHIRSILRVDRDACFVIMLDLRPSATWRVQHPEACLVTASGKLGPQSYFAKEHEEMALAFLRQVIRYMQTQPYAVRIFSFNLETCGDPDSALGGIDDNLFQKDRSKLTLGDYNPQAIGAFRAWLTEKYGGDLAKLRAAWRDHSITFESAKPVNSLLTQEGADGGVFRDPAHGAREADYFEFLSGGILRFLFKLGKCAKEETQGRTLNSVYYGYDVAHMRGYNMVGGVLQDNNFELDAAMKSNLIDYYAMVTSYGHRLAGSHFEPQHSTASMRLHRKMHLAELDLRTVTAEVNAWGRQRSVRESVEMIKRDLGERIAHGQAAWFADWATHGLRGVGYFVDADVLDAIANSRNIYRETFTTPRPITAQIAVFVSGKAWFYHDPYTAPPIYNNLIARMLWEELSHIGAPYDVYRLEDLADPQVQKQYKLYILLNAFALTDQDRKVIAQIKRGGKTLLSFYAPGYVDPDHGLKVEGIRETTGMTVAMKPGKEVMECAIAVGDHPLVAGLSKGIVERVAPYGEKISDELHPTAFGPVFYVDDPQATALGAYPDGKAALAVRDFGQWKSIYSAVPFMDAALLRSIARYAGVHLYCDPGPAVVAHGPFLLISKGYNDNDRLIVQLPRAHTVVDLHTNKVIATNAIRFELSAPGVRTFLLQLR